jgi:hypothetical protein
MVNKITVLIKNPDSIEIIRDQVSAILKIECAAQYKMATDQGAADAADYRIGIWKEKTRPWQITEDAEKKNPFPLVNVSLMGFHADTPPGPVIGQKKYVGEIYLDCYASGEFDSEDQSDDTDSAVKAWKIGRIVRNIILREQYSYLGLRGIVRDFRITEVKTGDPRNNENSAQSVTICRLVLSFNYYEDSPQVETVEFGEYKFVATTPGGEVLFDIAGIPGVKENES